MSKERKVIQVLPSKMGNAGWKTVRYALGSWARTARLFVILLGFTLPLCGMGIVYLIASR